MRIRVRRGPSAMGDKKIVSWQVTTHAAIQVAFVVCTCRALADFARKPPADCFISSSRGHT
jgi:hypothetical protein